MIAVYHSIRISKSNVSMKFGTLCPHFSPKKWKRLAADKDMELNFHSWSLKATGEHITPHSELKLNRESFEKASGDASDIPYLA